MRKQALLLHIRMCEEHPEFDLPENLTREVVDSLPLSIQGANSFANGVLAEPALYPRIERKFWDDQLQLLVCTTYLGSDLSGWPYVAHGGAIATVLAETMGETVWRLSQPAYPAGGAYPRGSFCSALTKLTLL